MMTPEQHYHCTMSAIDDLRLHAVNVQCRDDVQHLQHYYTELTKIERMCERAHGRIQSLRDNGIKD